MTPAPGSSAKGPPWAIPALIAVAVVIAYANSFGGIFVLDDVGSIGENPSLRHLATAFFPPSGGLTVSGRPLLNLSFALNWLVGGDAAWGYHAVNLAIHVAATLLLFGLVRRTLGTPRLVGQFGPSADLLALAVALLWGLHPLQTESVTYVVQRAESLAGLFYFLTLYCFVRGTAAPPGHRWFDASIAAGLLGALTKETAVTIPLVVLLYDRAFVSDSLADAWDRRKHVYFGLALTWLVVCWLTVGSGSRGGTAGFDTEMASWRYANKQLEAIPHYLRLAFWPHPLVLDYGTGTEISAGQRLTGFVVVGGLLFATLVAVFRRPGWGFLGAWFLLVVAPTSSFVPVATQTMAEHRMYLPLAAVAVAVVLIGQRLAGPRGVLALIFVAGLGGAATATRNRDYRSALTLWSQSLAYAPSVRGELNLGQALAESGRPVEAIAHYQAALALQPRNPAAQNNWGNALVDLGRPDEAVPHFLAALGTRPNFAEAHFNLANTLVRLGRVEEAVGHYRDAVRIAPDHARAFFNLANALAQLGRLPEAFANYGTAERLAPDRPDVHFHFGNALMQAGEARRAIAEYEESLRLNPRNPEAEHNLALARQADAGVKLKD